jgi:hypothetical protein
MPTAKQAAASRANSSKSSGHSATQGQAASRYNALKHGIVAIHQIMFDESVEDLAELAAEYHEHHSPADPDQRLLVDTLVHNEWRLRRMRRVEAVLWEHAADAFLAQHPEAEACNSAHAFATNAGYFERLQRMVNGCERNYHRALKELHRLKVEQAPSHPNAPANSESVNPNAPPPPPQPEQSKASSENLVSFRQNPKTAPRSARQPPNATPHAGPPAPASPAETRSSDHNPKPPQTT